MDVYLTGGINTSYYLRVKEDITRSVTTYLQNKHALFVKSSISRLYYYYYYYYYYRVLMLYGGIKSLLVLLLS
jgi:hypothetical protein